MGVIHNIKIGVKTQIATVMIVLLFGTVALSIVVLRTVLTGAVSDVVVTASSVKDLNVLGQSIPVLLDGGIPYVTVLKNYESFQDNLKTTYAKYLSMQVVLRGQKLSFSDYLASVWQEVEQAQEFAQKNSALESEVMALTTDAISKSNDYLTSISQKLADPVQQKKVSTLERLVIAGASINTNSNYTIQLLFKDLKVDISRKAALLSFLDKAIENAAVDAKRLEGTPFAQLPVDAQAAAQKARGLVEEYAANQAQRQVIRDQVKSEMAVLVTLISDAQAKSIRDTFSPILAIMGTLLSIFAVLVALVVALQILVSRSITRPIRHTVDIIRQLELRATSPFTPASPARMNRGRCLPRSTR